MRMEKQREAAATPDGVPAELAMPARWWTGRSRT